MAYDPSIYNPYGNQQFQPTVMGQPGYRPTYMPQTPVNGLVWVGGIEGVQMYQLPPNSVSPPLFLENEDVFFIKETDGGGAATIKRYSFVEDPIQASSGQSDYVTREYFDQQMNNIMEAINGKQPSQTQQEQQ